MALSSRFLLALQGRGVAPRSAILCAIGKLAAKLACIYDLLLILHNLVRWLVLLAALWVLLVSWQGLQTRAYGRGNRDF